MNKKVKLNQKLWDEWTRIHIKSDFYDLPSFLAGRNTLNNIEIRELGDIKNLSILHLQCHFGMDSISLARMGAEVTGVDFSEVAIIKARELADQLEMKIDFIQTDIYDLKDKIGKKFDLVFTSYGAISWLPDLKKWAKIISWCLKPGGAFYMVEFHPILWMLDDQLLQIRYPYDSAGSALRFENIPSYAEPELPLQSLEFNWHHGIGTIVTSLLQNKFQIELLNEHFYSPYQIFNDMYEIEKMKWVHKRNKRKIPYLISIRAKKNNIRATTSGL